MTPVKWLFTLSLALQKTWVGRWISFNRIILCSVSWGSSLKKMFHLCEEFVCCIDLMFMERHKPGVIGARDVVPPWSVRLEDCLSMQEGVLSLAFKMPSLDWIIFKRSVIQSSHLVLMSSVSFGFNDNVSCNVGFVSLSIFQYPYHVG